MRKIIAVSMLALLAFSCGNKDKTTETETEKGKNVKVLTLEKQRIKVQREYTAAINAFDKVYLAPTVPGRIANVKVEVNDKVQKGQTVVMMDDAPLLQLEVQYKNLEKEMARMDTLIHYESISQQIYDQTQAQYIATKTNYDNLKENTKLLAPFNGVVTNRFYDDKEIYSGAPNTQVGKSAIVIIEQIEKLKVNLNVSARFFPLVKNGMYATLSTDIYPGQQFAGKVSLVYPTIDPSTRTFTVEITIPNSDLSLRPGMYAKVNLDLDEKEALIVPSSAVLMQEGTSNRFIFIVENDKAKRVAVSLGERFDDKLEIIAEIPVEGKKMVVAGQSKLDNGDLIEVKEVN